MKSEVRDTREDATDDADGAKATLLKDLCIQPNVEYGWVKCD